MTDLEQRFWLFWGIAPKGSLKYKKGKDTLAFIKNELEVEYQIGYDEGHQNAWDERGKLDAEKAE